MEQSTGTLQFTTGDRFRKAREHSKVTSKHMADLIGVSRNTIGNYEHDRTEPTLTAIKVYAEVTGVPLWWLMGFDAPPDQVERQSAWYGDNVIHLPLSDEFLRAVA